MPLPWSVEVDRVADALKVEKGRKLKRVCCGPIFVGQAYASTTRQCFSAFTCLTLVAEGCGVLCVLGTKGMIDPAERVASWAVRLCQAPYLTHCRLMLRMHG